MKRIRLFTILLLLPLFISAQSLRDGDRQFESQQYFLALQSYKAAYAKNISKPEKARDIFQQAECYRMLSQWPMAIDYYDKAIKMNYPDDRSHLYLAQSYQMNGEYGRGLNEFQKYKTLVPSDPAADVGIEACTVSLSWLKDTTRWIVQNEAQLNTKSNDFCPAFSNRKHNALIFSSKRPGQTGSKIDPVSGVLYSDLFEATIGVNGKWSTPVAVQGEVNMPTSNDGASCITKNGNHIFYTKCGQKKKALVTCKIYYAEKAGNKWGTPVLIDFGLDAVTLDSFNFRHPAVSVTEDVMVFSSDMSGTTGREHSDLWVSLYDKKTKTWGRPVNMGKQINTQAREGFPYIAEDGSLYFSSDGHVGMGGLDIYKAPKLPGKQWAWGEPENMKSPINSPADDFGIVFDGKKQKGYLTSNRTGTKGQDDIWRFYYRVFNPPLEINVHDCENNVGIKNALVEITGNDGSKQRSFSDANGHCAFTLNENVNYIVSVLGDSAKSPNANAYFSLPEKDKGRLTTFGMIENNAFLLDFCLPPVKVVDMAFPAVLYDLDEATLRPESKDSLNYLYQILIDNPNLVIELNAHTDCRGSAEHNRDLAQRRAQACVDYLVNEKGIAKERLVAKGYGEDRPLKLANGTVLTEKYINTLKTTQEREALHQLNRRTTFKVLRTDYVDPKNPSRVPITPINVKKGYFDESGEEIPDDENSPAIEPQQGPKTPDPRQN
ncbi:MAG: OmpA family protein [Bacteroidota bacterium]|nr:OmpA family protein [Bacteroidota bacterium]